MQRRATGTRAYLASFVTMGVCTMLLGPSIDTFKNQTHTSSGTIGIVFTASSIGYLLGVVASGQLIAKRSGHIVLSCGLVIMAMSVAAIPFARSLGALFACQIAIGFGIGCIEIPGNSLILWGDGGGAAINALHAMFAIGAVTAPLLVGRSLAWTHGLQAGYFIAAAGVIIPLGLVAGRRAPANPHKSHGRGIPHGSRSRTALGTLWFFAYVGVEITFAGWIYKYAQARGVTTAANATFVGAAFLGAFAAGRLVGIRIARVRTPLQVLLIDHLIAAVACAILLIGHDNAVAVWVGTIIFGFGIASMFPSMLALSEQSIPSTGTVTSIYLVGSSVGTMVLPGTMGALIEHFGAVALPVECAIGVVITGGIVVAFRARVGGDRKSPNASVNR